MFITKLLNLKHSMYEESTHRTISIQKLLSIKHGDIIVGETLQSGDALQPKLIL